MAADAWWLTSIEHSYRKIVDTCIWSPNSRIEALSKYTRHHDYIFISYLDQIMWGRESHSHRCNDFIDRLVSSFFEFYSTFILNFDQILDGNFEIHYKNVVLSSGCINAATGTQHLRNWIFLTRIQTHSSRHKIHCIYNIHASINLRTENFILNMFDQMCIVSILVHEQHGTDSSLRLKCIELYCSKFWSLCISCLVFVVLSARHLPVLLLHQQKNGYIIPFSHYKHSTSKICSMLWSHCHKPRRSIVRSRSENWIAIRKRARLLRQKGRKSKIYQHSTSSAHKLENQRHLALDKHAIL